MTTVHTQFGTLVAALLAGVLLFEIGLTYFIGWHPIVLESPALMAILLLAFHSLTIDVAPERIRIRFGWGPFGMTYRVSEIRDARANEEPLVLRLGHSVDASRLAASPVSMRSRSNSRAARRSV